MKSHVWRPLFVALGIIATVITARTMVVPDDFGIYERGYMYGWHRKGNEAEWRKVTVKYRTPAYCAECHPEKAAELAASPHAAIGCENCHGPALNHPDDPPTLTIDRSRALCLRCHALLPYKTSGRSVIPGINPAIHNQEAECTLCHAPHHPERRKQP